jgi:hypothetical protein
MPWTEWDSIGGEIGHGPAAVSWGPGRIDVFAPNVYERLAHRAWENGWHDWEDLGGNLNNFRRRNTAPAVSSWAPGRLDVFVWDVLGDIAHIAWDGGRWSEWDHSVGGLIDGSPAAVSWGLGRIDVFAGNAARHLAHRAWENGWHDWEDLGGLISGVAVSSWAPGRLDVFVRAQQARDIVHRTWT